jgi:hypothetical protein
MSYPDWERFWKNAIALLQGAVLRWGTEENLRAAGFWAEIWIHDLPNMKLSLPLQMFCSALLQRKGIATCRATDGELLSGHVRKKAAQTQVSLSRPRLHTPLPFLHISNPGCLREDMSAVSFPQSFLCFILLTSLASCTRLLCILTSLLSCLPPLFSQQSLKQVSGLRPVSGLLTLCPLSVITHNFSIDKINIDCLRKKDYNY